MSMAGHGWSSVAITNSYRAAEIAALLRDCGFEVWVIENGKEVHVQVKTGLVDQACAMLFDR